MSEENTDAAPVDEAVAKARGWLKGRSLTFKIFLGAFSLGLLLLAGSCAVSSWRGRSAEKKDAKLEAAGEQAGREGDAALSEANNTSVNRRVNETEYRRREPMRRKADADAERSRAALEEAERRYRDEKKNFRNTDGPLADRLARAVADSRSALADDGGDGDNDGTGEGGGGRAGEVDGRGQAPSRTP